MARRPRGRSGSRPGTPDPGGPPTVVSIEWDHFYRSVLIDRSPGVRGVSWLDPIELGLSEDLAERLRAWNREAEALARRDLDDEPEDEASLAADAASDRQMRELAHEVRRELGPEVEVLLNGRPLDGYTGPQLQPTDPRSRQRGGSIW